MRMFRQGRGPLNRGSSEGYRGGGSTPIVMNGSGYLNPKQRHINTAKSLPVPNTMRYMNTPNKIGGNITDYSKIRKLCPPDHKLRNLFGK